MTSPEEPAGRRLTAVLVGGSAAFEAAQLGKLHFFVFAVLAFTLATGRIRLGRGLVVLLPSLALASTVLYGPLVNNKGTGLQVAALALSAALLASNATRTDIERMLKGFLAVTTIAALLALAQYAHVLPLSLFHGESRPTGLIYREPDFLGVFCAAGAFIALRSPLRAVRKYTILLVEVAAVVLSLARAAWLGFLVAAALMVVAAIFTRGSAAPGARPIRTLLVLAVMGVIVLIAVPTLRHKTFERVTSAVSYSTGQGSNGSAVTAQERRLQDAALRRLADTAPWYGQGLTASGRVSAIGDINYGPNQTNNVGSNWVLSWWAEGKWLALPLIALFMWAALRRVTYTEGLVLALVLVDSLYSNASLLPITWFLIGVCRARPRPGPAGRASRDRSAQPSTVLEWRSPQVGTSARPGR